MRHFSAPVWVVVSAGALTSYVAILVLVLVWMASSNPDSEFADLNRWVALIVGGILGLPTLALALLLLVRRIGRIIAGIAVAWMVLNAYAWTPGQPALAVWAASVGILVLVLLVTSWPRGHVASG